MTITSTTLSMRLPRLPNLEAVGGNAHYANYGQKLRARETEKQDWIVAIRQAKAPTFESGAWFNGPVCLRGELHLPTSNRPDFENAMFALKVLVDLLEPFRKVRRRNAKGVLRDYTKGMLGWIQDDKLIEWPWDVKDVKRSPIAPMTVIEISAANGVEQRRLEL